MISNKLQNGEIDFISDFLSTDKANKLFHEIIEKSNWEQGKIKLFGKEFLEPRLRCWYSEKGYTYSNSYLPPTPTPSYLLLLKKEIEQLAETTFNSILINYYRDGQDSMGWHQDNEPELGVNPTIASLSLGAERYFHFKHLTSKETFKILLNSGSLLIMKGEIQHYWKHQIPKSKKITTPRINLTFRQIVD